MIRKAVESEIDQICSIDTVARCGDLSRLDLIRQRVADKSCYVLLTEEGTRIAAYGVLVYSFYDCGMIDMLIVAPDQRRRGFGSELMLHMESECRTDKLFTSTNESNTPMRALLAQLGYSPSGVI